MTGHEVIASPDGRTAYVPDLRRLRRRPAGLGRLHMVAIDIAARKVTGHVDFGRGVRPHCPLFGPKDGLLYVTTELDNSVTVVDPQHAEDRGHDSHRRVRIAHARDHARRPPRLHFQCRSRAPCRCSISKPGRCWPSSRCRAIRSASRFRPTTRWYSLPTSSQPRLAVIDTALQHGEAVDSARCSRLRRGGDARRTLAAGGPAESAQQGGGGGPPRR